MKIIAMFNHKGGVSKTTTAFHLAWILAERGHTCVMVDADPQCNLTGLVMGYEGESVLEAFYTEHPNNNLYEALAPAFQSQPKLIEAPALYKVADMESLYLLPGHIDLTSYDLTLGLALQTNESIVTLQNLPGAFRYLADRIEEQVEADYIIVDLSPGLNPLNQILVSTADFFLVPTNPDFFALMALDSLLRVLPLWHAKAVAMASMPQLANASYPFAPPEMKFLGTVIQRFSHRLGQPTSKYRQWLERIESKVIGDLVPALQASDMMLEAEAYAAAGTLPVYTISRIHDFNSLVAQSQKHRKPVFALTDDELESAGTVQTQQGESRDEFRAKYEEMADRIEALTV